MRKEARELCESFDNTPKNTLDREDLFKLGFIRCWDTFSGGHLSDLTLTLKYSVLDEVVIPLANESWENEE